jgi:hypothetical protein
MDDSGRLVDATEVTNGRHDEQPRTTQVPHDVDEQGE